MFCKNNFCLQVFVILRFIYFNFLLCQNEPTKAYLSVWNNKKAVNKTGFRDPVHKNVQKSIKICEMFYAIFFIKVGPKAI
jgi:hypothetical protein